MIRPYYLKLLTPANSKPLKLHTFTCERCGKKFELPFWYVKKGRRFCSHDCRTQDPLKTLMSRVRKLENECWQYTGTIGWGGYGQIKVKKKNWLAHRLMWVLWNKRIAPSNMVVRHTCIGCPGCINPAHLKLGTQKENIHDCIEQGRFGRPSRPEARKFSDDDVRKIRSLRRPGIKSAWTKPTYKELANMFNARNGPIWQIVNYKTYKEVK